MISSHFCVLGWLSSRAQGLTQDLGFNSGPLVEGIKQSTLMTLISNHSFSGSNETMCETRRVGGLAEGVGIVAAGHDLLQTTLHVSIASTQRLYPLAHTISQEEKAISLEK